MIIRQTLNFAAHLVAGAVFGALAVVAAHRYRKDRRHELPSAEPVPPPVPPTSSAAEI